MTPRPPRSTPFPYTTLFRPPRALPRRRLQPHPPRRRTDRPPLPPPPSRRDPHHGHRPPPPAPQPWHRDRTLARPSDRGRRRRQDRKSTRLNSSHANISYAVF